MNDDVAKTPLLVMDLSLYPNPPEKLLGSVRGQRLILHASFVEICYVVVV